MKVLLVTVLSLLAAGCIRTYHEPAWCSRVSEPEVVAETDSTITFQVRCLEWTAFSDSTMRWDNEGNRLP